MGESGGCESAREDFDCQTDILHIWKRDRQDRDCQQIKEGQTGIQVSPFVLFRAQTGCLCKLLTFFIVCFGIFGLQHGSTEEFTLPSTATKDQWHNAVTFKNVAPFWSSTSNGFKSSSHHLCCYLNENITCTRGGRFVSACGGTVPRGACATSPAQEMDDPDVWQMDMTSIGVAQVKRRSSRMSWRSANHSETYSTHTKLGNCFNREGRNIRHRDALKPWPQWEWGKLTREGNSPQTFDRNVFRCWCVVLGNQDMANYRYSQEQKN